MATTDNTGACDTILGTDTRQEAAARWVADLEIEDPAEREAVVDYVDDALRRRGDEWLRTNAPAVTWANVLFVTDHDLPAPPEGWEEDLRDHLADPGWWGQVTDEARLAYHGPRLRAIGARIAAARGDLEAARAEGIAEAARLCAPHGPLTQKKVAELLGMDRAGMLRALDRLQRRAGGA